MLSTFAGYCLYLGTIPHRREMPLAILEWKGSYSVGIKSLDEQHERLLEIINELSGIDPETIDKKRTFSGLNALAEYAQTHFDLEEHYLRTYDYPKLAQQQREHVAFTAEVFRLAQALEQAHPGIHAAIINFTKDWYISHVLGTDREYIDFLLSKGAT